MQVPDWLECGSWVEFAFCVGEVMDVAVSPERIMVLVKSPKGIWRNHAAEWLEYKEGAIKPATRERALSELELYRSYVERMLMELETLGANWTHETTEQVIVSA